MITKLFLFACVVEHYYYSVSQYKISSMLFKSWLLSGYFEIYGAYLQINIVLTLQKESIDPNLVPRPGMTFKTEDGAKQFYLRYAKEAGFGINMGNHKPYSRILRCSNEGKGKSRKKDSPPKRKQNLKA